MSWPSSLPDPDSCDPKIRAVVEYWLSKHPESGLPGRQHIDPVDIPHLLPNVWLIDVVRDPLRFRFRLMGTLVVEYAGEDNTGKWFDERWPESDPAFLHSVVETRQPTWARGRSNWRPEKDYFEIERVRLPLARDGETVDMILVLTVFFDNKGVELLTS